MFEACSRAESVTECMPCTPFLEGHSATLPRTLYYNTLGASSAPSSLASPLIGPSTRQLCRHFDPIGRGKIYRIRQHGNISEERPILIPEQAHCLSHVLSICTGIRTLHIHYKLDISATGSDPSHRIAQLQNLEVLSLGDPERNAFTISGTLFDVYTSLPNMRRLKSLTLFRFECPEGQVIPLSLDELSPPSLTVVEVHGCGKNERTEVLLSWLFRPRKTHSVLSQRLWRRICSILTQLHQ